jgi:hypothetical protein
VSSLHEHRSDNLDIDDVSYLKQAVERGVEGEANQSDIMSLSTHLAIKKEA